MATRLLCDDCGWTTSYRLPNRAEKAAAHHECPPPARLHRRSCRTCGWSTTARTAGLADRSKRKHSCEYQMFRKGQRLRGEFRRSIIDRTPKPCLHKIANHQHGTYAAYVLDECRCEPCAQANRTYEADRTRRQAYGRWDNYVDAGPARDHVRALMAAGMGLKRIAEVGASQGQLWKLLYGKKRTHPDGTVTQTPSRRIRKDVAERLLGIPLDLAAGANVPGADTARRLQALVAIGWSVSVLGQRLGMRHPGNLGPVVHGQRDVMKATAIAVHALYVELADQRPPEGTKQERYSANRARRWAATQGWAPPLKVNGRLLVGRPVDETLLDDHVVLELDVDDAVVDRILAGEKVAATKAERIEVVRRWPTTGRSLNDLARLTGWKVERYTQRREGAA